MKYLSDIKNCVQRTQAVKAFGAQRHPLEFKLFTLQEVDARFFTACFSW
jgi:hypothetical protein